MRIPREKKPVYCWVDIAIAEIIHSSGWGGNRRSWSSPFANLPVRQLLCVYIYKYIKCILKGWIKLGVGARHSFQSNLVVM